MDLDALRQRAAAIFAVSVGEKKPRLLQLILFLGILGMLLIGLSECSASPDETHPPVQLTETDAQKTSEILEQQLLYILERMDGVGRAEVMITMEDSGESYYATEDKTDGNSESIYGENGSLSSIQSRRSTEQEYLLVENDEGHRQALLLSRSEPQVKGVIVICDGADQAVVRQTVTEAVCTVLHITSNRVYVAKAKAEK